MRFNRKKLVKNRDIVLFEDYTIEDTEKANKPKSDAELFIDSLLLSQARANIDD